MSANKVTPNKYCKSMGLDGARDVITIAKVSAQTLDNWQKHKPELFKAVVAGCVQIKGEQDA